MKRRVSSRIRSHDVRRPGSFTGRAAGTPPSVPPVNSESCFSHTSTEEKITCGSSALGQRQPQKPMTTKNLASSGVDELRPEYDLATLKGRVQGKYYSRATAGTTMVLLEPDVAGAFSDGASVNQALRSYLRTSRGKLPIRALQPTSREARQPKSKRAKPARG